MAINLGDLLVRLTGDSTSFQRMIDQAEKRIIKASKRLTAAGKRMTVAVTAPLAALAAVSVKTFADFDDAMTKSVSIMGNMTDEVRARMEEQARSISRLSITGVDKLAESYFFLASAGLNAEQSIAALSAVERFSVAGAFDMARATDLLTDAQSALGLVSQDTETNLENMIGLSDVLLKANTLANASAEQFSEALVTKSAAALRLLNKDVEEGVAVLAAFADQGVKGAAAGEKLSIVLRELQGSALKNSKVWREFGLRVFDARGQMLPLADIIQSLETRFGSMSDEQKKAAATMLGFQARSFSALQTLFGTSQQIREYERQLRLAAGTTQEIAERQLKSFSAQMRILLNNIKDVSLEIGRILAPFITRLALVIRQATGAWRGLTKGTQEFIVIAAAALAALGPLLLILGAIGGVMAGLIALFTTTSGALAIVIGVSLAWIPVLALMTDAILQMTGRGNLGLLDLVKNFRIGGINIATGMSTAAIVITLKWEEAVASIKNSFNSLIGVVLRVALKIQKLMFQAANFISNAIQKALDAITFGVFSNNFKANIEENNKLLEKRLFIGRTAFAVASVVPVLSAAAIDAELQKKRTAAALQISGLFAKDQLDRLTEIEKPKAPEVPKIIVPKIPEFTLPEILVPEPKEAPDLDRRNQEFEQISLRRFSLAGLAGAAITKAQDVKAKGVEDRLDTLIDITKQSSNVAILG